jgi:hypothetical protein
VGSVGFTNLLPIQDMESVTVGLARLASTSELCVCVCTYGEGVCVYIRENEGVKVRNE